MTTKTEARKIDLAYTKALNEGRVVRIGYGATFKTFNTSEEAHKAAAEYIRSGFSANVVGQPK